MLSMCAVCLLKPTKIRERGWWYMRFSRFLCGSHSHELPQSRHLIYIYIYIGIYYIIGFVCLHVCVSPVCVHTGLIRVACWIVRCSYIVRGCAWHLCSGLDAHLLWQVSRPPYSLNLAAVFRLAQACRGTWSLPRRGVGHGVASSHWQKCNDQAQQGAVQHCSFRSAC